MTWTAPKTDWSNGDLVTADDMNVIGENLAAVRNLQKASGATTEEIVKLLGDFDDVDSANLNLTLTTGGADVMVYFHGALKRIGSDNWTYARFDFDVDGIQKGGINGIATFYMTGHFYMECEFHSSDSRFKSRVPYIQAQVERRPKSKPSGRRPILGARDLDFTFAGNYEKHKRRNDMPDELRDDRDKQHSLTLKWLAVCSMVYMRCRRALTLIVDRARRLARKISRMWGHDRSEKV
ncbi:MAG: hypothetical protein OXG39_18280 [Chloroflexi bacterium]|nr:hypothetical protein [Chloroflexota bacterium]